jgi:VanZ family protein
MASRWLPVLVWAGVIFAFSSIPSLNSGLGTWDYVLRKLAHTADYAWALALTVAYAASDEVHQLFVRGRHGSPVDVAIDALGALIGMAAARSKLLPWTPER